MKAALDLKWYLRAQDSIAQGALTNSKRAECFVKTIYPTHLTKGRGCHVWDTQNNKYIDFICGLGSCLLGYGNPLIAEAMYRQAVEGCVLSLSTTLEVVVAEKIKEVVPFVEKMKFLKTGSEACSAAIKIARAKTGRDFVLSEGYHGHHDAFVSLTPPALGVPEDSNISKLQSLEQITGATAAVIVEPILCDLSNERLEYLRALKERCSQYGALLIFDEVITGFRFPKFTFSSYSNITPDIIVMGKAMGNGMPIGLVGGSTNIMNCGEYFVSSTFAGETLSLTAVLKTIEHLQNPKFSIEKLWDQGAYFLERFNKIWPEGLRIKGYNTRGVFEGNELTKALFWQESVRAGLLFGSSWFINFSHLPLLDEVLNVCQDILIRVKNNQVQLEGELPTSPFAAQVRKQ